MGFDTMKMAKLKRKSLYGYHIDKTIQRTIVLSLFDVSNKLHNNNSAVTV